MAITEILSNFVIHLIETFGYTGIFIAMTLESACIPLPSEVIMPFAGFVVNEGKLSLIGITLVGTLGNLIGSLITYYVGLKGGRPLLEKYGKYILITKDKLNYVDNIFNKYGPITIFLGRILPGIRTFISLPAGISRMNIKKFIIYTILGSLPWTFALGYVGVLLNDKWSIIRGYFHIFDIILGLLIVLFILYLIYKYRKSQTRDNLS
ncbi:MAG: DedA family protein [Methanobacteriaceae archaeon]|nr:DedA family protein [Methanobacteriaceae archaeon]